MSITPSIELLPWSLIITSPIRSARFNWNFIIGGCVMRIARTVIIRMCGGLSARMSVWGCCGVWCCSCCCEVCRYWMLPCCCCHKYPHLHDPYHYTHSHPHPFPLTQLPHYKALHPQSPLNTMTCLLNFIRKWLIFLMINWFEIF